MKHLKIASNLAVLYISSYAIAQPLEEIIVTAEHRPVDVVEVATSVTVITSDTITARAAQHLEDLIRTIPNLNAASGASRNRFFQIRGIGERSQYQEPINPSVGLIVDGVDFSGLGLSATTLDIDQVEVLRGPQGTLHGASALAGLISLRSSQPTDTAFTELSGTLGNYGDRRVSFIDSRPLSSELAYRFAISTTQHNGYIKNTFLQRSDTNNIDENTIRGRLRWSAGDHTTDIGLFNFDAANGFDAFSLDNTRRTLSDQPGQDRQDSTAVWLRHARSIGDIDLTIQANTVQSDTLYSYDEDWSYQGIAPDWEYSSFDAYQRSYDANELDIKLQRQIGDDHAITLGAYLRSNEERLARTYTYLPGPFGSHYDTDYKAIYGQWDAAVNTNLVIQAGLRFEERDARYRDSEALSNGDNDDFWGGKLALLWAVNDEHRVYLSLSKGYRAGGVNTNVLASIPAAETADQRALLSSQQVFGAEDLWNLELGLRSQWPQRQLSWFTTLFAMQRDNQQVKGSLMLPRADGSTNFIDYINNAAEGTSEGLETELKWQATDQLKIQAALGLLWSEFDTYTNAEGVDLAGREQAQAPTYQYSLSADWQWSTQWTLRVEMDGRDSYYFSDRHDTQSDSMALLHSRLTFEQGSLSVSFWGKNLNDETVTVRGFGSFGNDPRKFYETEPYYQFGAPRTFGLTVRYTL